MRLPIHLVFHVSLLKKYKVDREDPKRIKFTDGGGHHNMHKHTNFLIRWEGDPQEVATWHHEKDL